MSLKSFIHINNRNIYSFLNKSVTILQGEKNNLFLHDINRYKLHNETSDKTFVGKMNCGACCYLLNYYLKKKFNIDTKIMIKKFGYGKYLEDHCFLMKEDIIIDPTYRQMFLGNKYNEKYSEYLFEKNPFIFIGNRDDLQIHFNNLKNIYQNNQNILSDENLYFWEDPLIFKPKVDINKIVKSEKYAKEKGENYEKLHIFLKFI